MTNFPVRLTLRAAWDIMEENAGIARALGKGMKAKRSKLEKREGIQRTLEGYRRFDFDYIPFGSNWEDPDENFDYTGKDRRIGTCLLRFGMAALAPLLLKVAYGCKVVGKENLKALEKSGAVCVSNHIAYLDTLFVRQAVGYFRSFHTMGAENNKKGLGGAFIRRGGMLPLSYNLAAMRNFNREVDRLLKAGKIVNFYAEQAMWVNYQKPRPMKEGAFYYAVRSDVPVLPVFFTFKKDKRGHMRRLVIHILPAVYADEALPRKEKMKALKAGAEAAWKRCYEEAYGVGLEYLPDRRKL